MPSEAKLAELQRLRKLDELSQLRAGAAPDNDAEDEFYKKGNAALNIVGQTAMQGLNTASRVVDRFTGAPVRAAVGAAQTGQSVPGAYFNQFLRDPDTAPTGKQIASQAGMSEEEFDTPLIANPFTYEHVKASPAGIAGGAIETATDPLTYTGIGEAKLLPKLTGTIERLAPRVADRVGEFAELRAVKAATGENRAAIKKAAKVGGKGAGDVDRAVANLRKTGRQLLEEDEAGPPVVDWLSNSQDISEAAGAKKSFYGQKIGDVGGTVDRLTPNAITGEDLAKEVGTYRESIPNVGKGASVRKRLAEEEENLRGLGPMSFAKAQEIKGQFPWEPLSQDLLISDKKANNKLHQIVSGSMDRAAAKAAEPMAFKEAKRPTFTPSTIERDLYKGKPSADLGDGYSLVQRSSSGPSYNGVPSAKKDAWDITNGKGDILGTIHAEVGKDGETVIRNAAITAPHANKGLGTKAYDLLSQHYGGVASDYNSTSPAAARVYKKLGAKELPSTAATGERRLKIDAPYHDVSVPRSEEDLAALSGYAPAKEKYGVYKGVQDAGTEQAMRTLGRRVISPSSHALGLGAALKAGGDLKSGGLVGVATGVANQVALSRGAAFSARAADAISKKVLKTPAVYQRWLPRLQKAAVAGNAAVVGLHHELMANDPDYRRLIEEEP